MSRTWDLVWIGDDGSTFALGGADGITLRPGASGLDAAPIEHRTERRLDALGGAELIGSTVAARTVLLPVTIRVDRGNPVRERVRALRRSLAAGGRLRWVSDDRDVELRDVVYDSGLEGGGGLELPSVRQSVIALRALDPWWHDVTASSHTFAFDAGPPVTIGATASDDATVASDDPDMPANGGARVTVDTLGDVAASPVITATGPLDTLIVGVLGGRFWSLAEPLGSGDTLVVDSRRDTFGPRLNGVLDWSALDEASLLFDLPAGSTEVVVSAQVSAGSPTLSMEWTPRWEVPI